MPIQLFAQLFALLLKLLRKVIRFLMDFPYRNVFKRYVLLSDWIFAISNYMPYLIKPIISTKTAISILDLLDLISISYMFFAS